MTPDVAATRTDLLILADKMPVAISDTPKISAAWKGTNGLRYVTPENQKLQETMQ